MDNQNLQNLTKIAKIFQPQNIITSEEIDQVLKGIMEILATYKKGTESINEETKQVVNKLLDDVVAIHKESLDAIEEKKNTFADDFVSKFTELQNIVSSIQEEMNKEDEVPEEEDNDDEEEKQALVEEVLSQIKLPEYKETIVTGEEIVDKINELPLTDENKIDFSRIKNAPSIKGKNLLSPTVLSNAVDLDTTARADGYAIVWDDTNKRFKFAAGGSGTPGGSTTQLQYNNAGSFGGISGATTDGTVTTFANNGLKATNITATGSGGFIIDSNSGTDVALFGAGGGAGTTFYGGVNLNTMTQGSVLFAGSSGAITQDNANLFWDDTNNRLGIGTNAPAAPLHVGSNNDAIRIGDNTNSTNYIGFAYNTGGSVYRAFVGHNSSTANLALQGGVGKGIEFNVNNGTFGSGTAMTLLSTGLLGIGTTAPTHSLTLPSTSTGIALYNTADQTTNYERVRQYWSGNIFTIAGEIGGTGTARQLRIGTPSGRYFTLNSATDPIYQFDGTSSGVVTELMRLTMTTTLSSGTAKTFNIAPTINQSSTAGYTALLVNPTESTTGSGTKLLADFQVGGSSKFNVANTGITTITNSVDAASNQILNLKGSRATPATSDEIYQSFTLNNGSGTAVEVARFIARETTITAGSESAELRWTVRASGTLPSNPQLFMNSVRLSPFSNDGMALGASGTSWSDLFLASGAVINFNNGNATLTHSAGLLTSNVSLSIGTSNVFTTGTIEIGAASDTTISRSSAGIIAVEGVPVVNTTTAQTITNKRPQPRTASSTTASTLTPDLSSANVYYRTTQTSSLTINAPTGTPVIGETIAIYVDSAGAQTLTMDSTYKAFGAAFPASTTAGKTLMITAQYNGTDWKTLWANAV